MIICDSIDILGGLPIATQRFAKFLQEAGHIVTIVTTKLNKNNFLKKKYKVYECTSLPSIKGIKYGLCNKKKFINYMKIEETELLYVTIPSPMALQGIKAARILNIPVASHCHISGEIGVLYLPLPKSLRFNFFIPIFYKSYTSFFNKTDAVFFPTENIQKVYQRYNLKTESHVISNGIDREIFKKYELKEVNKVKNKYHLNNNRVKIINVGRLDTQKNIQIIIKAMPEVAEKILNIELLLIGDGILENKLKKLANNLNVAKNIKFLGKIQDQKEIAILNQISEIFILPSINDIEPLVIQEALSCGKVLIISDAKSNGAKKFIKGNGYLFKTENPKDLADKIIKIISNPILKKEMEIKSIEESKKYDIRNSVEKMESIFTKLIKEKNQI